MCSGGRETGPTRRSGAFWAGCREAQGLQGRAELCISHGLAERWRWRPYSRMGAGGDIPSGNWPKPLLSPLCFQPLPCPVAGGSTACACPTAEFALLGLEQTPARFTGNSDSEKERRFVPSAPAAPRSPRHRPVPYPPLCRAFLRPRSPTALSLSRCRSSPPRCSALDRVPPYCIPLKTE